MYSELNTQPKDGLILYATYSRSWNIKTFYDAHQLYSLKIKLSGVFARRSNCVWTFSASTYA